MSFINEKFMLKNKTAEKIYEKIKDLPIIDYHCHLDPKMIAEITVSRAHMTFFWAAITISGDRCAPTGFRRNT